ncbi:MAG: hydroxylamine oxidation protein HaoB, partial [Hyphomicrobium sp.]
FTNYIDALLLDEDKGADALRVLAPGKDVYVAVHLSDVWKVAAARPDRIEIAYRDFPSAGQSHGVMKATREWISGQKITGGYAIEPIGNAVRLHYFSGSAGSDLLIAKLLPFSTSNPMQLKRLQLVYQHRGFWIYRLN